MMRKELSVKSKGSDSIWLEKLQETNGAEVFKATEKLVDCGVDSLSGNFKEVLLLTPQEVLGRQRNTKHPRQ